MTDEFKRMRQLIGTTAEWAVDDLVIGNGEFAIETAAGGTKLKMGDGTSKFSALPYLDTGGTGGSGLTQTIADGRYLRLTGGAMTGPIRSSSFFTPHLNG